MKDNYHKFIGKWKYNPPWDDTDDFRSEYEISGTAANPIVKAKDIHDGEEYIISNIEWNGQTLTFESLMKSTGRKGLNKLTLDNNGKLNNEFTFTESSKLKKISSSGKRTNRKSQNKLLDGDRD